MRTLSEWLAWQERIHPASIDMSLTRIRDVADCLGVPSAPSTTVITVAGTNGKGSSVALLESIFLQAGYRVGSYTSPHILRYNERITIQGEAVSDEALCAAFEQIEQARGNVSLTYFEFGTLAALLVLQASSLDVMLLEVGLGGRLDAVNIVEPNLSIVTTVDLDHTDWLGPDREAIGREKAGIFRGNVPAVCGDLSPPHSLLEHARALGTPLFCQGRDFHFSHGNSDWSWWSASTRRAGLPRPQLKGDFQFHNAASVMMGLELLEQRLPVTQHAVRQGLMNAKLPGRFQALSARPLVIADVAHNPQGARALAETLMSQPCPGKTHGVFSMLADKDLAPVLEALAPVLDTWHVLGLPNVPRGVTTGAMLQRIEQTGVMLSNVTGHADLANAMDAALKTAGENDRVIVFGSFFIVAEVLNLKEKLC